MDIKMFFNVLLLALSLATVLVTLISFILYKLRQLSDKNQLKDPYQLEGLYFSRIAPHLEELNKKYRIENQIKVKKVNSKLSLGSMFLIIVGIIASSLFAQIYFSELQERRKKIAVSENYRTLVDNGLLKRYDYTPIFSEEKIKYKIEESQVGYTDYALGRLKRKKIILAVSDNTKSNTDFSFNAWEQFFNRYQIPFKKQKITQIQSPDLVILPHFEILKTGEKILIEKMAERGINLYATGPIARLDGTKERTDGAWARDLFGIEFQKCPDLNLYPTYFKRSSMILLNIPNNFTSTWPQMNKEFCALFNKNDENARIASIEVSYDGTPRYIDQSKKYVIVNSIQKSTENQRIVWQSMDPLFVQESINASDKKYASHLRFEDQIIIQTAHWLTHGIEVQISDWPNNAKAMKIISFPYLVDNDKSEKVLNYVVKEKIPATVFLSSAGINLFKEALQGKGVEQLEIAAYFDKYYPPLSEKIEVNKLDFKDIEKNRLDIEEEASSAVSGIYIRPDKLNQSVYYSAIGNHFNYILSSGIENGQIVNELQSMDYIHFNVPDPDTNEKIEKENRSIASISQKDIFNDLSDLHLYHFYDLDVASKEKIENLIKTNPTEQFTTFRNLTKWLLSRSNIKLIIREGQNPENEIDLLIENLNDVELTNLHLQLGQDQWVLVENENEQNDLSILEGSLRINKMMPAQKIRVSLKRSHE